MNRLGFIGGSDARRIMEGDWHSLWLEKTGQQEPTDLSDNLAVQIGVTTEDFHLSWFMRHALDTTKDLLIRQQAYTGEFDAVPCKGTVDGLIHNREKIVECKHTYDRNTIESCIKQYMPQLQFYMMVSQTQSCYLSVIFGNRRWESVEVSRDDAYIERMIVHIKEFWQLVQSNTPPDSGKQVESLSTDHILVNDMVRRDATADNEFISRCHDYIEQETNAKSFESAKADLKAMVADNEREVYCDLLTIKRDKRGALRINVKEN
jgi:predicted phage-related endonuclease